VSPPTNTSVFFQEVVGEDTHGKKEVRIYFLFFEILAIGIRNLNKPRRSEIRIARIEKILTTPW
jgi:hypothetical protein